MEEKLYQYNMRGATGQPNPLMSEIRNPALQPVERSLAQRIVDLEILAQRIVDLEMRATSSENHFSKAMEESFQRLESLEKLVRG